MGSPPPFTCKKNFSVTAKEIATATEPKVPDTFPLNFFPMKMLSKNPAKGASSNSKAKFVSIRRYPFSFFKLSISIFLMFRYTATSIASPTATSAAATAIEKNTNTCPAAS